MRIILVGLGALGQGLLGLLASQESRLGGQYALRVKIVAALDTSGAVVDPAGIDPGLLLKAKRSAGALASLQPHFRPGRRAPEIIQTVNADAIVEVTPTNIVDGVRGCTHIHGVERIAEFETRELRHRLAEQSHHGILAVGPRFPLIGDARSRWSRWHRDRLALRVRPLHRPARRHGARPRQCRRRWLQARLAPP